MTRVYLSDTWFIVHLLNDVINADQWRPFFERYRQYEYQIRLFVHLLIICSDLNFLPWISVTQTTDYSIWRNLGSPFVKIRNKSSELEGNKIVPSTHRILMLDYESSRHWSGAWLLFQLRSLVKKCILHSSYIPCLTWRWCLVAVFQV